MPISLIGLFPLSEESQRSIFTLKNKEQNRALATNQQTSEDIVNTLAASKDIVASSRALRHCTDTELLLKSTYGQRLIPSLWNPNHNPELLVKYLDDKDPGKAIVAYLNPTTPQNEIIKRLTPKMAESLVEIGGNVGDRVVRAYSLVIANPWMHQTPEVWSNTIRRAIAGSPELTILNSEKIRKAGWSGWDSHNLNPIKKGLDIKKISVADLVKIGSSATDLEAINRSNFTLKDAKVITGFGRKDAEPHIIAKLVSMFGPACMTDLPFIAMTRINSAAWLNPTVNYCVKLSNEAINDLAKSINYMEKSPDSWSTYFSLAKDWTNSLEELAHAAVKI